MSIFSGCGGLDLGFLQEGIFSERAIDIDEMALATYRHNLSDVAVKADLSTIVPVHEGCEILLAGAPCQGFSTAGKRKVDDPRNDLLMRVADVALKNQSKVVVVENVPAALSGSHRHLWESLEGRLRSAGYNVRRILIEGEKSSMAQRRKRLFLLCWKGSDCINVFIPSSGPITLRDALRKLPDENKKDIVWPELGSRDSKIAAHLKQGQKLSNVRLSERAVPTWEIPEVFGQVSQQEKEVLYAVARLRRRERIRSFGDGDPVSLERLDTYLDASTGVTAETLVKARYLRKIDGKYELAQTYNGRYRRLSWNELSPTVDTRFGRVDLFVHPDEDRGMTQREAARIQGFPDSFSFCGNRKDQFVQIGNAVPPPMAAKLADFIREAILKA
ncbi:DNA cytosine methyltransferase [Roseovarius sp.]|uniref:DNA cytosine methyltransferase n=1 Tax=Roseovarius sp. TaxID=1486281 RepID=UPI003A975FC1